MWHWQWSIFWKTGTSRSSSSSIVDCPYPPATCLLYAKNAPSATKLIPKKTRFSAAHVVRTGTIAVDSCISQHKLTNFIIHFTGRECQKADWEAHKGSCRAKISMHWCDQYRKCKDGSQHEGKLELMTWPSPKEDLGWGGYLTNESDDLKKKFEGQFGGDEARFYKHWPQGFRWTCCGTNAEMKLGCDHHGTGSKPCSCDFCKCVWRFFFFFPRVLIAIVPSRMGKPLPDSIYKERCQTRHGLKLLRGPDPRSFHPRMAQVSAMARSSMGLDLWDIHDMGSMTGNMTNLLKDYDF